MTKLKTCPFCGGEAMPSIEVWIDGNDPIMNKIKCSKCKAQTKEFLEIEEAIAAWNRRGGKNND